MTKAISKREANKIEKQEKLLEAAGLLFMEKGIQHTSVDDIVKAAKVAKGTYYLYFKDKSAIEAQLITMESSKIMSSAVEAARDSKSENFVDGFIVAVDHIIDYLENNKMILEFIKKDLSYALYSLSQEENDRVLSIIQFLQNEYQNHISPETIKDAKIVISLCIEFLGATIYSALVYEKPLAIRELRPYIHKMIRTIIEAYTIKD